MFDLMSIKPHVYCVTTKTPGIFLHAVRLVMGGPNLIYALGIYKHEKHANNDIIES